ncbi:chromosome-associated kinesin KIF4B [Anabrus simplex]|uniref:chromosome-associated kinesin KIF4B n=1 Tax=Anabrus simplex TaxID=316456 RepID=UPI0034DD17CC
MESVSVSVRVRPLLEKEKENIVLREPSHPNVISIKNHKFSFDHVFIDDNQQTVYSELMEPIVEKFLEGFNCSVMAYGHTGTGKTYTMGTDVQAHGTESAGLITRSMETIFERNSSTQDFKIEISFIEIYNEEVYDLLDEPVTKLEIKKGKRVCRTLVPVDTVEAVSELLKRGMSNRHTRPTVLNDSSSRSHAVLTIYRTATDGATSKLYLVDLAGLEGLRKTNNKGMAMREGINISQGLRVLGNILQKLSSNSKDFIPYRESVLTMILQDGLQSKNIISVIACVSPSNEHESDTLSTLRFVEETKNYKCKPEISYVVDQNKPENSTLKLPMTARSVRKKKYLYKTPHSNRLLPFSSRETLSTCRSSNIRPLRRSLRRLPLMEMNSPDTSTMSTMNVSTSMVMTLSPMMKHYYEKYKADLNETIENAVRSQLKRESVVCCLPQIHARENGPDGCNETSTEAVLTSLKEELKHEIRQLEEHSQNAFKEQLLTEMKSIVKEQVNEIIQTQRKKIPDLASPSVLLVNRSVRYCTRLSMRRMSQDKENITVTPEIEARFSSRTTPALSTVKRVVSRGCSPLVFRPSGRCAVSTPLSVLQSSPDEFISAVSTIQRRPKRCIPHHDDMELISVGSHSRALNDSDIETPRYSKRIRSKQDTISKRKESTIQRRQNRCTPDHDDMELTSVGSRSHTPNNTDVETPRYSKQIRSKQDTICKRKGKLLVLFI